MEYKFKIENEITNCFNCPLISIDDAFSECRINEDVDIEFEKIPENCPLQKVAEVYEKTCRTCDYLEEDIDDVRIFCSTCYAQTYSNWKKRSEITN